MKKKTRYRLKFIATILTGPARGVYYDMYILPDMQIVYFCKSEL